MFSQMIQSLLSSGGQQQAIQRAIQLQNKVQAFHESLNPTQAVSVAQAAEKKESFEKVLRTSAKSNFGTLLRNPETLKVKGTIYNPENVDSTSKINEKQAEINPLGEKINASKAQLMGMISQISNKHGVDDKLVKALIRQESGFNPNAVSSAGAQGLMQLMPSTAKSLGVKNSFDPRQNIEGGVKYLRQMLDKYNGNKILALAAYNAGPGAVDKYDGVPPYKETQNYVKAILSNYL